MPAPDTDLFFERQTEQLVARCLSDSGAGVRVFGSFAQFGGGRIEAFYNGELIGRVAGASVWWLHLCFILSRSPDIACVCDTGRTLQMDDLHDPYISVEIAKAVCCRSSDPALSSLAYCRICANCLNVDGSITRVKYAA